VRRPDRNLFKFINLSSANARSAYDRECRADSIAFWCLAMSQTTLKWLRFAVPGLIILLFSFILGKITGLWSMPLPTNLKDVLPTLSVILPAGVYYLTPFRTWANRRYFNAVSGNIRSNLLRISGLCDKPTTYSWQAIRGVFYHLIDSDKSLSSKASLAYFNGFIWTTCADVRVVAISYALIAIVFAWLKIGGAVLAVILFVMIAGASSLGSKIATHRHKLIGDEQLEIIQLYYRDELRKTLEGIRDRGSDKSSRSNS
jgi:hypothetical protein